MRKIINLFLLTIILFFGKSFAGTSSYVTSQKVQPPGTVLLKGTKMYVDVNEVTNFYYLESLNYYKQGKTANSSAYQALMSDSEVWQTIHSAKYRDYPLAGISQKQIAQYCKFRTAAVDSFMAIKYPKWHKEYKIIYKLPTAKQWEQIAQSKQAAHKKMENESYAVHKIRHNIFATQKIYGLFDNVSECVLSSDYVAMGGNWKNPQKQGQPIPKFISNAPESLTGFRCVAFIEKRK